VFTHVTARIVSLIPLNGTFSGSISIHLSPLEPLPGLLAGARSPVGTFTRRTRTPFQGIHNNIAENSIRPTAVGRKNWLFIGDAEAGERSAIIYTIVECCRRRGIDPHAYLRDVLSRLPLMTNWQIKDVTPEAWAKAQAQSKTPSALAA
jgi:Transposase IS66 family/IS66 C-terminal element